MRDERGAGLRGKERRDAIERREGGEREWGGEAMPQ